MSIDDPDSSSTPLCETRTHYAFPSKHSQCQQYANSPEKQGKTNVEFFAEQAYIGRMARRKNPHAVALSKLGASKGGQARAAKLTEQQRRAIAKKAAQARWAKKAGAPPVPPAEKG
jgi:hypothetical protein